MVLLVGGGGLGEWVSEIGAYRFSGMRFRGLGWREVDCCGLMFMTIVLEFFVLFIWDRRARAAMDRRVYVCGHRASC